MNTDHREFYNSENLEAVYDHRELIDELGHYIHIIDKYYSSSHEFLCKDDQKMIRLFEYIACFSETCFADDLDDEYWDSYGKINDFTREALQRIGRWYEE